MARFVYTLYTYCNKNIKLKLVVARATVAVIARWQRKMKTRMRKREVHAILGIPVDWSTVHARVTWSRGFPGARSGRKSPLPPTPPHRQFLPKVLRNPLPLFI